MALYGLSGLPLRRHRRAISLILALYGLSGLPLRLIPFTEDLLCRSVVPVTVVPVTVVSSAFKALWVVVMYTMNNHTYNAMLV